MPPINPLEAILDEYRNMTYSEANSLLTQRFTAYRTGPNGARVKGPYPTLGEIQARRRFDEGDHWQEGTGFIGQLPTGDGFEDRTEMLKAGFVPEEVVTEVLDTHVQNVLGEEPQISIEPLENPPEGATTLSQAEIDDTLGILKEWWDERDNTRILAECLRSARRETAGVLRCFIPAGMLDGEGRITARDLKEALSKIWIRAEHIEDGGVLIDETTATRLGLFKYRVKIEKTEINLCEYSFVDLDGLTVWGTASNSRSGKGAEEAEPLMLGGMLPIYEMKAAELISSNVLQAQRAVNLSGTMLTRNNNLAGSRERLALNVQPPGEWRETTDPVSGQVTREFVPGEMKTGPATMNFLQSLPIFDDEGRITGFGNPNVIFTDPVAIETFTGTSAHWREVIYNRAKMRHLLIADNATASGKSRIEARREFQSSLNDSKGIADAAGRWAGTTPLHIAAHFIGAPGRFLGYRIKFDAMVSTIEKTAEELNQIRADYEAGLIDLRTALELAGHKNVDEIIERRKEAGGLVFDNYPAIPTTAGDPQPIETEQ